MYSSIFGDVGPMGHSGQENESNIGVKEGTSVQRFHSQLICRLNLCRKYCLPAAALNHLYYLVFPGPIISLRPAGSARRHDAHIFFDQISQWAQPALLCACGFPRISFMTTLPKYNSAELIFYRKRVRLIVYQTIPGTVTFNFNGRWNTDGKKNNFS